MKYVVVKEDTALLIASTHDQVERFISKTGGDDIEIVMIDDSEVERVERGETTWKKK